MIVKTVCYIQPPDSPGKATKHVERFANLKLLVDNPLLRSWVSGKVGVSSHSQSHKLQQLKWYPWSKDHVLAFSGQNSNYEAVVTREEKRMFCTNVPMKPLELDLHNSCFVFFSTN